MAPVRVVKALRDVCKGIAPKVGMSIGSFSNTLGPSKPLHESSLPKVVLHAQDIQADGPRMVTNQVIKKLQSRMRRASRFSDHGSCTAFKKVVRRRERASASALGLPSSPPITYDLQPQSPFQHPVLVPQQRPISPGPTGSRRTVRENRFFEKHMGVPFSIYVACKSINTPNRAPLKAIERHGSETRRSRLVLLARDKGSPFRGSKRRAVFMRSSNRFILAAMFEKSSKYDSPHSSSSPRAGPGRGEVQFPSHSSVVKDVPQAPSQEPLDAMEDVIPAPLIHYHPVSQPVRPVQSLALVRRPTVPAFAVQGPHTPPPAQPSSKVPPTFTARLHGVQPLSTVYSTEQTPDAQPTQPGQLLPTTPHFCRNLGRASKEMLYVFRALSAVRAWERCALPPTTSVASKTQSSCAFAALAWLPPAPTKAKLPYTRPRALYSEPELDSR